jgi:putative hydrolase of the HAD superfamily
MEIKNIIFDFGGVLYDIDYLKCSTELAKLSLYPDLFKNLTLNEFIDLSSDFEKGFISRQQFRNLIREKYFISADNQIFDKAWNSMLIGIKEDSIRFLKKIKDKFRISLLSNSNPIHHDFFYKESKEMLDCFEGLFFSFQIRMRKPENQIFEYVCKKMEYIPEQTLFVDDSFLNIECAKLARLKIFHFSSEVTLSDLLHSIEIITHI